MTTLGQRLWTWVRALWDHGRQVEETVASSKESPVEEVEEAVPTPDHPGSQTVSVTVNTSNSQNPDQVYTPARSVIEHAEHKLDDLHRRLAAVEAARDASVGRHRRAWS